MSTKCIYDRVAPDLLECRVCHRQFHTTLEPHRVHTHCGQGPKAPEKTAGRPRARAYAVNPTGDPEIARREAICETCWQFNGYQCRALCTSCNGYAKWKRALREGTCPEDRWD